MAGGAEEMIKIHNTPDCAIIEIPWDDGTTKWIKTIARCGFTGDGIFERSGAEPIPESEAFAILNTYEITQIKKSTESPLR